MRSLPEHAHEPRGLPPRPEPPVLPQLGPLHEACRVLRSAADKPHAALGVPSHAPPRVVRKARKTLVLRLHPDKNEGHPLYEAATKAMLDAFEKITRRASYQAQL